MIKLGISTACLYPMLTEEAFAQIARSGVQCCEVFFNADCELEDAFTRELARRSASLGVPIVSVHPYTAALEPVYFFSGYPRRTEDGFEQYKKYFHAMNILGARYLIFHGDAKNNLFSQGAGFEHMSRLCEMAKSFGVQIAHENVSRCKSSSLSYLEKLAAQMPEMRFVLDIKQAVRSQVNPFDIINLLGNRIVHLHLSDHSAAGDCLAPGKGTFDFESLFSRLREVHFSGCGVIELYRANFGDFGELTQAYGYLLSKLRPASFQ